MAINLPAENTNQVTYGFLKSLSTCMHTYRNCFQITPCSIACVSITFLSTFDKFTKKKYFFKNTNGCPFRFCGVGGIWKMCTHAYMIIILHTVVYSLHNTMYEMCTSIVSEVGG